MAQDVSYGDDAPKVVNVIIEIQKGSRNKIEVDKATNRLFLDRVNGTLLGYPTDYGYIPDTLCDDGDPLDALLIIDESVPHGVVVPSRPIGVLYMIDDGEGDDDESSVSYEVPVLPELETSPLKLPKPSDSIDIEIMVLPKIRGKGTYVDRGPVAYPNLEPLLVDHGGRRALKSLTTSGLIVY